MLRHLRSVVLGALGAVLLAAVWELYKAIGPQDGWGFGRDGMLLLPRTSDLSMPHTWEMIEKFSQPVIRAHPEDTIGDLVLSSALYSLKLAAEGWAIGVVVGLVLAIGMTRFRIAEAAVLPWVVASQTVPLIAIAPVLGGWGNYIHLGDWQWDKPQSIAVIAAYLAFFPVAVGALRGLKSPEASQLELMHAYGVGWWRTLFALRLPASVRYLLPSLRLAATSAVIGAVVAEVSIGQPGGIGRLIVTFAQAGRADPVKAWPPIFGAVAIGLIAAGVIALLGVVLRRYRRGEAA